MVSDRLIVASEPVLGSLHPFLYSTKARVLNDIMTGSSPGCESKGFPATVGWDPVSLSPFYGWSRYHSY